ncbi:MAG: LptA/OstA family protein [Magnetococcales bacterium]|nr:LptA/OstA family protein [Magnetococcales bacterium]
MPRHLPRRLLPLAIGAAAGWFVALAPLAVTPAEPTSGLVITSDRLEVDDKGRIATFSGHVLAVEKTMRLNADQMIVHYQQPGTGGDGQKVKVRDVEAKGHVTLEQANYRGTADLATYKMGSNVIELIGQGSNAVVLQGENRLEGERIQLFLTPDRRLERVVANSGNRKRVQARLATHAQEAKPAAPVASPPPAGGTP